MSVFFVGVSGTWVALLASRLRLRGSKRFRLVGDLALAVVLALGALQVACGHGASVPRIPSPGTPVGTHTVTITGTSGTMTRSTTITLIVN